MKTLKNIRQWNHRDQIGLVMLTIIFGGLAVVILAAIFG